MKDCAGVSACLVFTVVLAADLAAADPSPATAGWLSAEGDQAPAGWTLSKSKDSKGTLAFHAGELVLAAEPGKFFNLDRLLNGADGSDDAPLVASCTISALDDSAAARRPAEIAMYWSPDAWIAVGLGPQKDGKAEQRAAWVEWQLKSSNPDIDGHHLVGGTWALYRRQAPATFRLVLSAHAVMAYASADGWTPQLLMHFDRKEGFNAHPDRVIIGRPAPPQVGQTDGKPLLENDPGGGGKDEAVAHWRFSQVDIGTVSTDLSPALLKTYDKKASLDDTRDAIAAPGIMKEWKVLGPFAAGPGDHGPETKFDPAATDFTLITGKGGWKDFKTGDSPNARIIVLSDILPGAGGGLVRYAATTFTVDAPRLERFWFDGSREVSLYVNGREIANDFRQQETEVVADRLGALVPIQAGENTVVVKVVSGDQSHAAFTCRHEPGDVHQRIAVLKRLAIDFPDESESVSAGWSETASLWEGLGQPLQAAAAMESLSRMADIGADAVEDALIERARLHHLLEDETATQSDIDGLTARWSAAGADPVVARLKAAHLWTRLGEGARAAQELSEAADAPGSSPDQIVQIGLERARLAGRTNDLAGVAKALRELVKHLPDADPRRGIFLVTALYCDQATNAPDITANLAALPPQKNTVALELLAGLQDVRKDVPGRLATLRTLAAINQPLGDFEDPLVICAEAVIAAKGDQAEAIALYKKAIAQLTTTVPAAGDINSLRLAYWHACLAADPPGAELDARVIRSATAPAGTPGVNDGTPIHDWTIIGPFDNTDFVCYDKPPVNPAHPDITKPVQGKTWIPAPQDAFDGNGILDLNHPWGPQNNCVAFLVTEISSNTAQTVMITAGSDDGLTVWVNGNKVHEDRDQRGVTLDELEIPAKLKKGKNRLVAMVQQGGGGWGLEMKINTNQPSDLDEALGQAFRVSDRVGQAQVLGKILDRLIKNKSPEIEPVARVILRGFADQRDVSNHAAENMVNTLRWRGDGWQNTSQAAAWLTVSYTAWADHQQNRSNYLLGWGAQMVEMGNLPLAQQMFEQVLLTDFNPAYQAPTLGWMGELKRRLGLPKAAVADLSAALNAQVPDSNLTSWINDHLSQARSAKVPPSGLTADFESDAQLRTAIAALGGDVDHALSGFQKLLDDHGGNLCHDPAGHIGMVATVVADDLAKLPADHISAYRDMVDGRAQDRFKAAGDDPYAIMRAVQAFPWSTPAVAARVRASGLWFDHGAPGLAAATAEMVLNLPATVQDAGLDRGVVTALWASAAAAARDRASFTRASAALARLGPVTINGKAVDGKAFAAALEKQFPAPPATPAAAPEQTIDTFSVSAEDARFAHHLGEGDHVVTVPTLLPGTANGTGAIALNTTTGIAVIDLPAGTVRWHTGIDLPDWRDPLGTGGFSDLPLREVATTGGRVFARVRRGPGDCLEARSAADGTLLWSTEAAAELAGLSLVSSPTASDGQVYALLADTQVWAVAFDAGTGALRWRTPVTISRPLLPVIGDMDVPLTGFMPAPAVSGRDCYITTNDGSVVDLDAATGTLRWQSIYGHSLIDAFGDGELHLLLRRSPIPVLVGADRLWILPADFPGVVCLARKDGAVLWHSDLETARTMTLAGSAGSERVILQGTAVDCLDGITGSRLWRVQARPNDATIGRAAVIGDTCLVGTRTGLWRIGLADGETHGFQPWNPGTGTALPGNLVLCGDTLVGVGDGAVVAFAKAPAPAPVPIFPASSGAYALATNALPTGTPGQPLALQWRIPASAGVLSFETPNDAQPGDGECYVRCNDCLMRIDTVKALVKWRTPMPPGGVSFHSAKDVVIVHYPGDLIALDRATGAVRWHADLRDLGIGDIMSMSRPQGDEIDFDSDGDWVVAWRPWNWPGETVISAADGHVAQQWNFPDARIISAHVAGGRIFTVIQHGHLNIEERDPTGATVPAVYDPGLQVVNDVMGSAVLPDRSGILVTSNDKGILFNFATREATPATALVRAATRLWKEDGKLVSFGLRPAWHWGSFIADANGTNLFVEDTWDNGPNWEDKALYGDHHHGGKVIRFDFDHDNHDGKQHQSGILARGFDGKEAWFVPLSDVWQCRMVGMIVGDKFADVFTGNAKGQLIANTIDLDAAKLVGATTLPGWCQEPGGNGAMPMKEVAGTVLYGTPDGVFGCVRAAVPVKPANTEISALACDPAAKWVEIPQATAPITIDGNLDDWQGIAALPLGDEARRNLSEGATASAAGPGAAAFSATMRAAWDAAGIYLAVEVTDPIHRDAANGASPLLGDNVVVGIDPRSDDFGGTAPIVFSMALNNGQPRLTSLVSNWLTDDRPAFRVALHANGPVYECMIPWATIRARQDQRPGDRHLLRLGVAVFNRDHGQAPDAAIEFGQGLSRGFDKQLLRWVACVDAPAKK